MIIAAYLLSFLCLILNGSLFVHLKPPYNFFFAFSSNSSPWFCLLSWSSWACWGRDWAGCTMPPSQLQPACWARGYPRSISLS